MCGPVLCGLSDLCWLKSLENFSRCTLMWLTNFMGASLCEFVIIRNILSCFVGSILAYMPVWYVRSHILACKNLFTHLDVMFWVWQWCWGGTDCWCALTLRCFHTEYQELLILAWVLIRWLRLPHILALFVIKYVKLYHRMTNIYSSTISNYGAFYETWPSPCRSILAWFAFSKAMIW